MPVSKFKAVKDTLAQVREDIITYRELGVQEKAIKENRKKLAKGIIAVLGKNGVLEFNLLRCKVVSQMYRTVPWREICTKLAHVVYPTHDGFRRWVRQLAKAYPKKPKEQFILVTEVKPK